MVELPARTMRYRLRNDSFDFLQGLTLRTPGARLIDLQVGVSRVREPLVWDPVAFTVLTDGDALQVRFDRPDNWANLAFDIVTDVPAEPMGRLDRLPPIAPDLLRAQLRQRRCVFLGAARDCVVALPATLAKLRELAALFAEAEIRVYENDSVDATGAWLEAMAGQGLLTLTREQGIAARMPLRTERLAYGRNRLLQQVLVDQAGPRPWDYVCWVDMDGLVGERFSTEGFLSNFQNEAAWDAVFPLSASIYYDIWALREAGVCGHDYVWDRRHQVNAALADSAEIHAAYHRLAAGKVKGWVPVRSAFGGFGLYKASVVGRGRYVGVEAGEEVCEHVPYHAQLCQAGARLFLNPGCITHIT